MKKLMTMLAAAAMAFGLYADEPLYTQSDSFEGGWTVTGNWSANGEATVTQDDWGVAKRLNNLPYGFDQEGVGDKYLTIKTPVKVNETDGLVWANADTDKTIGTGIYFDGLVNFTNCEDPVEVTADDGTKLVVYTVESEIENTDATKTNLYVSAGFTKTNLYVSAGFWNGATWEAKAYDCGSLDNYNLSQCENTGFWRVTIRSLADISEDADTNPGFLVFVNGAGAVREEGIGFTGLNSTAAAWASKGNLFPSLVQEQGAAALTSITAVAFAGQGSIDTVAITRNEPADFVKDEFFTLSLGEHVESLTYTVNGGDVQTLADGSAVLPYALNMKVEVKTVTYEAGEDPKYGRGDWTLDDVTITGNTFEPQTANLTGVVNGKDVTARILVDGVGYPTFKDAIAALKDAEIKTLTLNKDVTVGYDETEYVTEAFIDASEGEVVLDLAGKTLNGANVEGNFVVIGSGNLKIVDSSDPQTGKIVAGENDAGAVEIMSPSASVAGMLTIEGGIFDGAVVVDKDVADYADANASIAGGSFKSDNGEAFYLHDYVADGFEEAYDEAEGYWTVAEIPGNTLKVIANEKATFVLTVDGKAYTDETMPEEGIEVKPDVAYELVATAADNYEYDGEKTKTISGDMPDEALTLTVPAPTAVEKTITYKNENEEEIGKDTYSVEKYPEALKEYSKTGYNPADWTDENGDVFTLEDLMKINPVADIELTASFEGKAITYTINYNLDGGTVEVANPTTYTIESEDITLNTPTKDGFTFAGWTGTDLEEPTMEVTIETGSTGNREYTATWQSVGPDLPPWVPQTEKEAYDDWKVGPGKTESDFTGDDAEIAKKMEDSFLLDCEPTEEALKTAKENFKITSITKDAEGNWVVLTADTEDGEKYGNGLIKLEAFESVGCDGTPVKPADQSQLFWKASLVHPTAN